MKQLLFLFVFGMQFSSLYALTADELMKIHKVTTTEMNNINTPQAGSLVYNTSDDTLFFYTGSVWKRLRSSGNDTIVNAGGGMDITGNGTSSVPYLMGSN